MGTGEVVRLMHCASANAVWQGREFSRPMPPSWTELRGVQCVTACAGNFPAGTPCPPSFNDEGARLLGSGHVTTNRRSCDVKT